MPTIEMTRPYASSVSGILRGVNVDRLLQKIREWEIYGDTVERKHGDFERELQKRWTTIEKNKQQVLKNPEYLRPLEAIQKTIKEILGDAK